MKTNGRGKIYASFLDTIGDTPLVELGRLAEKHGARARVLAKLEFFNPLASVKDRIGLAMIESLEAAGKIGPDTLLVEPTSGNTGVGLAFVAASKGYRLKLVMPESMSIERRKMLAFLGAELELTPAAKGMGGAIARAKEILEENPNAVAPGQFVNPANPAVHRNTTGPEIWNDTGGKVDAFIAGVGTGGTLTGAGGYLKEQNPDVKIVAVEPTDSPVLSGGAPGPHKIQGIGAGFIPDILDTGLIDEILQVSNDDAITWSREAGKVEGLPGGISSGAALKAALEIAKRDDMAGKTVVVIIPSFAERYISSALFDGIGD
ncbi:cysteine synthase A [Hyphobacterium sp.]|uniref:cysteine synthase A n=1 Tax=Hyphobacterium sp. TaxID=2004662 RepID=UPI00374A294B